jgi:hypothetical protein
MVEVEWQRMKAQELRQLAEQNAVVNSTGPICPR